MSSVLENDFLMFYRFQKVIGNYPVTEAIERWTKLNPAQRAAVQRRLEAMEEKS